MTAPSLKNWVVAHAVMLGFVWGFAEGTLFFIVPDVLISLVALFAFRRSLQCMVAVLVGSLAAGVIVYCLAHTDHMQVEAVVRSVPFIRDWMFEKVHSDLKQEGAYALLMGPSSGIPYKIYAVLAPAYVSFESFLLASIPARLERFILTWAMFAAVGYALRNKRERHTGRMLTGHMLYWALVYTYYLTVVIHGS